MCCVIVSIKVEFISISKKAIPHLGSLQNKMKAKRLVRVSGISTMYEGIVQ